jgi:hypothetical protein
MSDAFDRTGRFLATLSEDPNSLADRMAHMQVEILAPSLDAASEIAIALTATLLLRLDRAAPTLFLNTPATRIRALPRLADGNLLDVLMHEHVGFRSAARFHRGPAPDPLLRIVFAGSEPGLRVSSVGWALALGTELDGVEGNPLAACFAAVLASAEALKALLLAAGIQSRRIRPWRGAISLWDYSLSPTPGAAITEAVSLDGSAFAGAGGVASATGWALGLLPLAGTPHLIDDDHIDETNLNRHLTANHEDRGAAKAELLGAILEAAGACPRVHVCRWDAVSDEIKHATRLGVISVDDDAARRAFQLDMPQWVLNGGTADTGFYQVTSHDFLTDACLGCIAHGDQVSSGAEHSAARRLGLPLERLRGLIERDHPLPDDVLARLSAEDAARLRGKSGRAILRIACGELAPLPDVPAVSAPMLSAAPGIVLGAEIAKWGTSGRLALCPPQNALNTSILSGPHKRWLWRRAKRPECTCTDEAYRAFYRRRWTSQ